MKRGMRYAAVITFTFVLVLTSATLVSAETGFEAIGKWFSGLFGGVNLSSISDSLSNQTWNAQILLFFLVALIIYAIAGELPFLGERGFIALGVSLIIAALATLYLKSQEINTILLSYGALGIALTVVVPFIAVAVISKKLYDKEMTMMSKVLWVALILAYILKIGNASTSEIGTTGYIFSIGLILAALLMAIWENKVYLFLWKEQLKSARDTSKAEALSEVTAQLTKLRDEILAAPSDAVAQPLIQKFNRLVKRQNELGGNWKEWG